MICNQCGQREAIKKWSNISTLGAPSAGDPGAQRAPMHPGPLCVECVIQQLGPDGARIATPLRELIDGKITLPQFIAAVRGNQPGS